jgi:hypothetical protein
MKKKCFIGRRLISLERESTINVLTVEEEDDYTVTKKTI